MSGWLLSGFSYEGKVIRLVFTDDDVETKTTGLSIGRDSVHCELVIDCSTVSRRHATFVSSTQGICIEDLTSANGTYLDGHRIDPGYMYPIEDCRKITLGGAELDLTRLWH